MTVEQGIYVVGKLVKVDDAINGYKQFHLRSDEVNAATRFSFKEGSPLESLLAALKIGDTITLRVAPPYIGYSKNGGKPYLAGFYPLDIFKAEEE